MATTCPHRLVERAHSVGSGWKGRRVTVIEVSPDWYHTQYIDDATTFWHYDLLTPGVAALVTERPTYGGPPVTHKPLAMDALVIHDRSYGCEGIEIVIVRTLGDDVQSVARDAWITTGPLTALQLLRNELQANGYSLALSTGYAAIMSAVLDAQCKATAKAESEAVAS